MLPLNVNIGIFLKEDQSWVCFQSVASCEGRLHLIDMTSPLNLTVKEVQYVRAPTSDYNLFLMQNMLNLRVNQCGK